VQSPGPPPPDSALRSDRWTADRFLGSIVRLQPLATWVLLASLLGFGSPISARADGAPSVPDTSIAKRGGADSIQAVLPVPATDGMGSASQFMLRGRFLDQDDYLSTTVAGVPLSMPTHPHGLPEFEAALPELIGSTRYDNGSYSVQYGDFSSAGAAQVDYREGLTRPIMSVTGGDEGYRRALVAGSTLLGPDRVLGALEIEHENGPWVHPDDDLGFNALLRYGRGTAEHSLHVTAMGSEDRWNTTDRIPDRAVTSGELSRFGAVDPTDGGTSARYSLSAEYADATPQSWTTASAFLLAYKLDLFSNYTYFLSDSVHGDQYEQTDRRIVSGLSLSHASSDDWLGWRTFQTLGADVRLDDIPGAGIYRTEARSRLTMVRKDQVLEASISPYVDREVQWTPRVRTRVGARADGYFYRVASSYAPFSGDNLTALVSPKASVLLGPWNGLDMHLAWGYNHSADDARGASFTSSAIGRVLGVQLATEHIPTPGAGPVSGTPLLLQTRGTDLGVRYSRSRGGGVGVTVWDLDIASEHVVLGDAVLPSPGPPSRRTGIELSADLRIGASVRLAVDAAHTRARFRDSGRPGEHIPGMPEDVLFAGVDYQRPSGPFAGLHLRYLGPKPLTRDNSVRSAASSILNAETGYDAHGAWTITVQALNILDCAAGDASYFYVSRLPGEPTAGIVGLHSHPEIPRSIRLVISRGLRHGERSGSTAEAGS